MTTHQGGAGYFFAAFSFTLNRTISLTNSNGIGSPNGNCTVPLLVLYPFSFSLNASTADAVGKKPM